MMSVEENKTSVRRWIELWNAGEIEAIGSFVTADCIRHDPNTPEIRGPEAERQLAAMYLADFPDLRFTIEHLVAEGDLVLAHLAVHATHRGELLGIPPTGNKITLPW